MNLLLLLSALFSALTGVTASARAPQVATELTATVPKPAITASVNRAMRPVAALPDLRTAADTPRVAAWALAAIEPIFAARRRE